MFKTKFKFLTRPADRLEHLLLSMGISVPETFNFKDATARTFGYENRQAVPQALKDESIRDEALTTAALNKRRMQQAEYLSSYALEVGAMLPDPRKLMDDWQPSAKRPQRSVVTSDHARVLIRQGIVDTGFNLVAYLKQRAENSSLRIEKSDVERVMTAMDCMQMKDRGKSKQYQLICCDVRVCRILCKRTINRRRKPACP